MSINNPDFENYHRDGKMYPPSFRSKTRRRATLLLPTWICSCQSVGTVNFALHFTTNVTISISILQPLRSWVATFHLRPPMACSSYECFVLRVVRFSNELLRQGYIKERFKSSLRKFYCRDVDLTKQYDVPFSNATWNSVDNHIQWHIPLIRHYTNFLPLLIWTLILIWLFT